MSTKWGKELHLKIIVIKPKVSVFRIPFVTVIYAPQVLEQVLRLSTKWGKELHLKIIVTNPKDSMFLIPFVTLKLRPRSILKMSGLKCLVTFSQ